ncbi:MAG: hypothetical protein ACI4WT_00465 [Oligosphaeraceae bacterium]
MKGGTMLKRLTLSALLGAALALAAADVTLPCAFAAGQVTRFDRTAEALPFVDFDKAAALAAASDEEVAKESLPTDELLVERAPEAGRQYAVFTVQVAEGRTLSRHDYVLVNDRGEVQPCLGLARGEGAPFDFRHQALRGPEVCRLVFPFASDSYELRLRSAFAAVPLPEVGDFRVQARPEPPKPEPASAPESPAAAASVPPAPAPSVPPAGK